MRQPEDLGRPDLEGRGADGQQVVRIEGKLGAGLGPGQLGSYVANLESRCRSRSTRVGSPTPRGDRNNSGSRRTDCYRPRTFVAASVGLCRRGSLWEDVVQALRAIHSAPFHDDLEQFNAMYSVLNRHIARINTAVVPPERIADVGLFSSTA